MFRAIACPTLTDPAARRKRIQYSLIRCVFSLVEFQEEEAQDEAGGGIKFSAAAVRTHTEKQASGHRHYYTIHRNIGVCGFLIIAERVVECSPEESVNFVELSTHV